jgi:hypothetical protein
MGVKTACCMETLVRIERNLDWKLKLLWRNMNLAKVDRISQMCSRSTVGQYLPVISRNGRSHTNRQMSHSSQRIVPSTRSGLSLAILSRVCRILFRSSPWCLRRAVGGKQQLRTQVAAQIYYNRADNLRRIRSPLLYSGV